jgi:hypothetical protein
MAVVLVLGLGIGLVLVLVATEEIWVVKAQAKMGHMVAVVLAMTIRPHMATVLAVALA